MHLNVEIDTKTIFIVFYAMYNIENKKNILICEL